MIEIKKTEYNDVPFVPCNDCSHWEDCQEQAYKEGYRQGRADASGQEIGITSDEQFITYKGHLYQKIQDKIKVEDKAKKDSLLDVLSPKYMPICPQETEFSKKFHAIGEILFKNGLRGDEITMATLNILGIEPCEEKEKKNE